MKNTHNIKCTHVKSVESIFIFSCPFYKRMFRSINITKREAIHNPEPKPYVGAAVLGLEVVLVLGLKVVVVVVLKSTVNDT